MNKDASGGKILVIDDEEIVHQSIRRILSRLGYDVDSALTAHEGLDKLEKDNYSAVITDLMMPEMNGIEMLHAMRERGHNPPTIMITGYPTIKTAIQALRLGAMDYIPKPFTRQELLSPLNRALRRSADMQEQAAEPEQEHKSHARPGQPVLPNTCFYLPEHSWALYNQDGTLDIGVESGFLKSIPPVDKIEMPLENDLVEQGHTGFKLKAGGEVHGVFMPFSGRIVATNDEVSSDPAKLAPGVWVIRIIPSQLKEELEPLKRRERCDAPES